MSLPIELTDEIIDKACAELPKWPNSRKSALKLESALALVSHAFRERTNTHRFSHVSLAESRHFINDFFPILQSDVWTPQTGVARHIHRFELCLKLHQRVESRRSNGRFENGRVKEMLNIIFRGASHGNRPSQTLVLTVHDPESPFYAPAISRNCMNWKKMGPRFRSTLEDLLKENPNLIRLELNGFTDIPLALLTTSRITQLSLRDVTFNSTKQEYTPARLEIGQLQHLEILELDYRSLLDFVVGADRPFRSLRKLTFNVDVYKQRGQNIPGIVLSLMLTAIVQSIPPTCDLEISLHYDYPEFDQIIDGFCDILLRSKCDYAAIDAFLDNYSLSSHSTIVIRFNVITWDSHNVLEDGENFFRKYFPLMNKGARRKVFDLQTYEDMHPDEAVSSELVDKVEFSVLYID